MKLHADLMDGLRITARGPGWIAIGENRYEGSVWVENMSCRLCDPPLNELSDLSDEVIEEIIQSQPEVVLFGSGQNFALAPVWVHNRFLVAGIGVESMDTAAACRTFNILVAEGRKVVALLTHS